MAKIPKLIKALLNFSNGLPEQLLNQGYAVLKGLTGNANFTTLPIDLALLKTTLDAYSAAIADARDGSKKAVTQRDRFLTAITCIRDSSGVSVQCRLEESQIDRKGCEICISGQALQDGVALIEELFRQPVTEIQ